jgi:hypothetical protein
MTSFRCVLAAIIALATVAIACGPAHAQVVHRSNVPAGDATSTGGSFSIHFPIAFSDVELKAEDKGYPAAIVYMLTGVDDGGTRFTATETPFGGLKPKPMEEFMESTKNRPGAVVSDVHRDDVGGMDRLSFALTGPEGGYYFRMIRSGDSQYMLVVQFPESQRDAATGMKDDFFNSFKIAGGKVLAPAGK